MGIGITPNGSKTCWSRRRSVAIANFPEEWDNQRNCSDRRTREVRKKAWIMRGPDVRK